MKMRRPQLYMSPCVYVLGVSTIIVMAICVYGLAIQWVSKRGDAFLGFMVWDSNMFAFHPIFMICGFYVCQLLGILSWMPTLSLAWQTSHTIRVAKIAHMSFQSLSLIGVVVGLTAVVMKMNEPLEAHFTSIHSIVGVTTIVFYVSIFVFALFREYVLKRLQWFVSSNLVIVTKSIHRILALATFCMTTLSVLTGIANFEGHSCSYPQLEGCQVANAIGMLVVLIGVLLTTVLVGKWLQQLQDNIHYTSLENIDLEETVRNLQKLKDREEVDLIPFDALQPLELEV